MMGRFFSGVLATLVALAAAAFVAVWFGFVPARADAPPPALETWAAHRALDATIDREQPQPPYPYGPVTDATLAAGAKLYMANCSVCHGSGVGEASNVARGLYVRAPQFARHGVDDDPAGETYWKIEHGIRFTGMPSYAGTLSEEQIWQIAYFLKNGTETGTVKMPAAAEKAWMSPHGD
jgi:mono/diheme cytochrome c family protein